MYGFSVKSGFLVLGVDGSDDGIWRGIMEIDAL